MTKKTLILGASGMLGSAVFRCFRTGEDFDAVGTIRRSDDRRYFPETDREALIAGVDVLDSDRLISLFGEVRPDVVVNCVGLVKQLSSAKDPLAALPINALLPHRLARLCTAAGARLIHVSTDCVFSGAAGNYVEGDFPDADDLYGRSKLLGETVGYDNAITLRTSIIGREPATSHSLIDWFLSQQGRVRGFTRAIFSGLPTWELALVMRDVVVPNKMLKGLYHVSAAPISKYDLLRLVAAQYGKEIEIEVDPSIVIDRSLDPTRFTQATGYEAEAWPELIRRMHENDWKWKANV